MSTSADDRAELDAGYTLLYKLLDDEAMVDSLLVLKSASSSTEQILEEIAAASVKMRDQLLEMAEADEKLTLEMTGLPKVETSARLAISSDTAMKLLGAGSGEFDFRVLVSQEKAMSYGSHLAAALAQSDPDASRTSVLEGMSNTMADLHDRVTRALMARHDGS